MNASLVFVYGTLKRGFLNYVTYLQPVCDLGKAAFVSEAVTAEAEFCLVLSRHHKTPILYRPQHPSEQGYSVPDELFRVDKDALQALDILEGIDDGSYREEVDFTLAIDSADGQFKAGETIRASIHLKVYHDKLTELENVPAYTAEVHATKTAATPALRILACLYGAEVTDEVQQKLDQGLSFDEAWDGVVA